MELTSFKSVLLSKEEKWDPACNFNPDRKGCKGKSPQKFAQKGAEPALRKLAERANKAMAGLDAALAAAKKSGNKKEVAKLNGLKSKLRAQQGSLKQALAPFDAANKKAASEAGKRTKADAAAKQGKKDAKLAAAYDKEIDSRQKTQRNRYQSIADKKRKRNEVKDLKKKVSLTEVLVEKYNRNHGAGGKFSSGSVGGSGTASGSPSYAAEAMGPYYTGASAASGDQSRVVTLGGWKRNGDRKEKPQEVKVGDKLIFNGGYLKGKNVPVTVMAFGTAKDELHIRFDNAGTRSHASSHELTRPPKAKKVSKAVDLLGVMKFNQNHGAGGKFSSGSSRGTSVSGTLAGKGRVAEQTNSQKIAGRVDAHGSFKPRSGDTGVEARAKTKAAGMTKKGDIEGLTKMRDGNKAKMLGAQFNRDKAVQRGDTKTRDIQAVRVKEHRTAMYAADAGLNILRSAGVK